ncbi:MAG: hypothetical protein ACI4I9_10230 [Porcipelethomonas sp.]
MSETMLSLVKICLFFFGIFALIFIVAMLTPKIAAMVDRLAARIKKQQNENDSGPYKVRSIYDLPEDKNNNDAGEMKNGEE